MTESAARESTSLHPIHLAGSIPSEAPSGIETSTVSLCELLVPVAAEDTVEPSDQFDMRQGVAVAFKTILHHARARWQSEASRVFGGHQPGWIDLRRVGDDWNDALLTRLNLISLRTLVLELNVAHIREELSGEDPASRFRSFFASLAQQERLHSFFDEYQVLAKKVVEEVETSLRTGVEALIHLRDDAPALHAGLGFDPRGDLLVSLKPHGNGDRHNQGRSVLVARFASGKRLVYKPRPSTIDVHFRELLNWIHERDRSFEFRVPAAVAVERHGWFEYVEHQPCSSEDEVRLFFQREGEQLALMYALDACDLHFENLIAVGPWPVLVDLEALFHPPFAEMGAGPAAELASGELSRTVLRVGLLPWRFSPDATTRGADIGAVSAPVRQMTPTAVLTAEGAGTDQMRLVHKPIEFGGCDHRVTLPDGTTPEILGYVDEFEEGFSRMYAFLHQRREEMAVGPLRSFASDRVRVIVRGTRTYARLLQESAHPDLMRSETDHRAFLERLGINAQAFRPEQLTSVERIIEAEQADLRTGNIPVFWARVNSLELEDSRGSYLSGILSTSPYDALQTKLQRLGPGDLALQKWVIRTSLATLTVDSRHLRPGEGSRAAQPAKRALHPSRASIEATKSAARDAAIKVGERLAALAYRGDDDATWLSLNAKPDGYWDLGPLQDDLYDGLPGVILFLAYLSTVTDDPRARELAEDALVTWRKALVEPVPPGQRLIGAYSGLGGSIYALTHLGVLWRREDLLAEADAILARIEPFIAADRHLDVIAGAAGCIGSLLALHSVTHSPAAMRAAVACGERLLAEAVPQPEGCAWPPAGGSGEPLGGFSHGARGIGWSLSKLAAASGQARFKTAARNALAYDRRLFDPTVGRWRDLRKGASAEGGASAFVSDHWCYGAPGTALALMDTLDELDATEAHRELEIALHATIRGFGGSHCLCHGDLGNLEVLLQAERRLEDQPLWSRHINQSLADILSGIERHGWRCGNPLRVESVGLMTGLAGIGLGLLRAAHPERVPAVLLLEPPRNPSPLGLTGMGDGAGSDEPHSPR